MSLSKIKVILLIFVLFYLTKSDDSIEDYDDNEQEEFEDCQYEIDYKTFKKTSKLQLCNSLEKPPAKTRIQLQIYSNHTEEKLRFRALAIASPNLQTNKSLVTLTTDVIENFKYSTSLLTIDDFQHLSIETLKKMLLSLIKVDFNLLSKNLKKVLIVSKGGHKEILSCSGNVYPKQDLKQLNMTTTLTKAITCDKEKQYDQFFSLQEKIYFFKSLEKKFQLVDVHQDDPKKVTRTVWFTCNNPASCGIGLQNKKFLDKTVNYVIKSFQKQRTEKKT